MRQLWTRASRSRFLLVVAALSVITLAVPSPIYSAVRAWHVSGDASASPVAAAGRAAAKADCSKAAALQVATPLHFADTTLPNPIAGVLCGAFTGPGSQAMVATFAQGTCLPNSGWAVFRFTGGAWQLVPNGYHAGFVAALVAVGSDIRETVPVWRKSDGPCNPTGGTKARIWHWDGTRLTASAWKQVTPGIVAAKKALVFSPLRAGISCFMTDDGSFRGSWVYCWLGLSERRPIRSVKMGLDGRLDLAATIPVILGKGGPSLRYGRQVTVGRFRCLSLRSGMRCTVVRSGKGFLFNSKGARRVGP